MTFGPVDCRNSDTKDRYPHLADGRGGGRRKCDPSLHGFVEATAAPRGAGAGRHGGGAAGRRVPGCGLRPGPRRAAPAAGGDHPLGAVHRRAGQPGDPGLFRRYPDAVALAEADPAEPGGLIRSTGFFHAKARAIIAMSEEVVARFGGRVPDRMEDLVTLRGVGRKTANVVLGVAFREAGLRGGHPCDPAHGEIEAHLVDGSRRDRDRCLLDGPGRGVDRARAATHPPRPPGLRGAQPPLPGLRAQSSKNLTVTGLETSVTMR